MPSVDGAWACAEQAYLDEFGPIERPVYDAAQALWPQVERTALQVLRDAAAGQHLLMKACALVTRKRASAPDTINNLPAYLYRTWQRLLLAELEKENGHRQRDAARLAAAAEDPALSTSELERRILLQQIIQQMDGWTRRVFEYLTLGFSYEEIAAELGGNGHAIRVKYDRQLKALAQRLNQTNA
jgi:DNA-directed RNA polymerase specialized sigma24 family protein